MKFAQLEDGKSYTNGKDSVRTIRQLTKKNEVFYIEDNKGVISTCSGQDFAAWARRECLQPAGHRPVRR